MVRWTVAGSLYINWVSRLTSDGVLELISRYGMVAALCEEVKEPAREVPRAMVLSVAAAAITGLVYLVRILAALDERRIGS